ncbi:ArgS-related anticodon-binding protein NrtL [Streptomyces xinghaiensis]|uniref:ArgS-related anticodon-binding protein NrtL n=1 Tax=Streptomyces xinghaiensis TaxID=1038928 RepID=UPI0003050ED8|nr:DALR anticodon-binding domain-containing protein [Streptomyces xinghaiensis]MZE79351.1 arginine--tRNA ligase [Streptomyces sp. SID5475]
MTPTQLSQAVLRTVRHAVADGELRVPVPERVVVKPASRPGHGDYATGVALQLARPAGLPALGVAGILRSRLAAAPGIELVEVSGPGFLNITLADGSGAALVRDVLRCGTAYGHSDALAAQHIELAFPGETRAAVTADVLRRLLRSQGAVVTTRSTGPADPDWAGLGVISDTVSAGPGAPRPATPGAPAGAAPVRLPVRPVPVGASAAELLRTLGADAARWGLLRPAAHDHPRLTGDEHDPLLVQRESNPLFRVRYAHARARALVRNAADLGVEAVPGDLGAPEGSGESSARDLLAALREYPAVLDAAARHRAPDRIARHLEQLADAFFRFHDACPVLPRGDEKPGAAHRARTALAEAAGTVLAGGLLLLGIDAPTHL